MQDYQDKDTIEVVDMLVALANAADKSLADGKANWADAINFFAIAPKVLPAINGIKNVPGEISALDLEGRTMINRRS